jgi:aspartate 1-decarboxylase
MFRKVLQSKIHRATVTRSDLHYEGSIAIDENLLNAADIRPYEAVHVWNVNNGLRLQTYAVLAPRAVPEKCV